MKNKLRFGVLSTASIGMRKVLPAMLHGQQTMVTAIASRDLSRAQQAAQKLGIAKAYGSYEELLADPEIDAVYNPLPNHLHVPWTIKAAEAGKHVLCEKPIALTLEEAKKLLEVRANFGVKICEAFMIRSAPQWIRLRELIQQERIGKLLAVTGVFSYSNANPANIRNQVEYGGGGVYDIGCYLIHAARYAFQQEPKRVISLLDRDPVMKTDRLATAILDFEGGQASFVCGTQMIPCQKMNFFGTKGRIEIEIPFNAPPEKTTRIFIDSSGDFSGSGVSIETFPAADQYTLQGDAFAQAVFENSEAPVPLEDTLGNMAVIDAIYRSAQSERWEKLQN
ncbi:Gfo/Idh/MocA family protein [Telmatobacter bradus]|uniref:Gfo/Idh/MocA family protein n=1 Tax=Telmatobacter bradus TaxID=474953 RepID=UPI003B42F167